MGKSKWIELTSAELKSKEKNHKRLIIFFMPLIILLFSFILNDYLNGEEIDFAILTIAICSLGGPAALYQELKEVKKELKNKG